MLHTVAWFLSFFLFFSYVYLGKFKEITLAGGISSILLVAGKNVCEMKPLASDEHVVPPVIVNTAIIIMQFLFWSLNSALFRHGKMAALYRQWLQRLTRPDWLYCGSRFLYIRPCWKATHVNCTWAVPTWYASFCIHWNELICYKFLLEILFNSQYQ